MNLTPTSGLPPAASSGSRRLAVWLAALGAVGLVLMALLGWGAYRTLGDWRGRADEARRQAESALRMRWLIVAMHEHHASRGLFPRSLQELQPSFQPAAGSDQLRSAYLMLRQSGVKRFETLLENPLTGDRWGYEYIVPVISGPLHLDRDDTPVIFQLRGGRRADDLPCARLDGGVR